MSDQLTHYGVLGMKWGRRKDRRSSATSSSNSRPSNPSNDHKRKVKLEKKKLSELTNDEIRELNTRLQLERQYRDLNPQTINKGKNVVTDILAKSAKQAVTNYATKYVSKAIETSIQTAVKKVSKSK